MKAKLVRLKGPFQPFNCRQKAGERGFTLVEVLIAMIILSVGILALSLMMKQSVGSTDYGRKVTTAENLALQKMEGIKAGGYDALATALTQSPEDYGTITGYPEYRREVTNQILRADAFHPDGVLNRVTVTVSWRSVGSIGQGGSVPLSTFISR